MTTTMSDAGPEKPQVKAKSARKPRIGDMVHYWVQNVDGSMRYYPAMLIEEARTAGWNINVFKHGHVTGRGCVLQSDKPRSGCWTWPEPEKAQEKP